MTAAWVPRDCIHEFMPAEQVFPPAPRALENRVPTTEPQHQPAIVAAVITAENTVLLVRRKVKEGVLSWQFPAGEALTGEAPEDTAVRETREEVGLVVAPSQVIGERTHPATGRA